MEKKPQMRIVDGHRLELDEDKVHVYALSDKDGSYSKAIIQRAGEPKYRNTITYMSMKHMTAIIPIAVNTVAVTMLYPPIEKELYGWTVEKIAMGQVLVKQKSLNLGCEIVQSLLKSWERSYNSIPGMAFTTSFPENVLEEIRKQLDVPSKTEKFHDEWKVISDYEGSVIKEVKVLHRGSMWVVYRSVNGQGALLCRQRDMDGKATVRFATDVFPERVIERLYALLPYPIETNEWKVFIEDNMVKVSIGDAAWAFWRDKNGQLMYASKDMPYTACTYYKAMLPDHVKAQLDLTMRVMKEEAEVEQEIDVLEHVLSEWTVYTEDGSVRVLHGNREWTITKNKISGSIKIVARHCKMDTPNYRPDMFPKHVAKRIEHCLSDIWRVTNVAYNLVRITHGDHEWVIFRNDHGNGNTFCRTIKPEIRDPYPLRTGFPDYVRDQIDAYLYPKPKGPKPAPKMKKEEVESMVMLGTSPFPITTSKEEDKAYMISKREVWKDFFTCREFSDMRICEDGKGHTLIAYSKKNLDIAYRVKFVEGLLDIQPLTETAKNDEGYLVKGDCYWNACFNYFEQENSIIKKYGNLSLLKAFDYAHTLRVRTPDEILLLTYGHTDGYWITKDKDGEIVYTKYDEHTRMSPPPDGSTIHAYVKKYFNERTDLYEQYEHVKTYAEYAGVTIYMLDDAQLAIVFNKTSGYFAEEGKDGEIIYSKMTDETNFAAPREGSGIHTRVSTHFREKYNVNILCKDKPFTAQELIDALLTIPKKHRDMNLVWEDNFGEHEFVKYIHKAQGSNNIRLK